MYKARYGPSKVGKMSFNFRFCIFITPNTINLQCQNSKRKLLMLCRCGSLLLFPMWHFCATYTVFDVFAIHMFSDQIDCTFTLINNIAVFCGFENIKVFGDFLHKAMLIPVWLHFKVDVLIFRFVKVLF